MQKKKASSYFVHGVVIACQTKEKQIKEKLERVFLNERKGEEGSAEECLALVKIVLGSGEKETKKETWNEGNRLIAIGRHVKPASLVRRGS